MNTSYKILIVEDDEGLNRLIQRTLQKIGYKAESALSGEEALEKFSGEPREIVLLDYRLPGIQGKELIDALNEKATGDLHFMMMTGYGDQRIAVEMMKLGALDYFAKDGDFLDVLPEKLNKVCVDVEKTLRLQKTEHALDFLLDLLAETGRISKTGGWELDPKRKRITWTETTRMIHEVDVDFTPDLESTISFFPTEKAPMIREAFKQALESGYPFDIESPFITYKGNSIWVRIIGRPTMKNGQCVRLTGVLQDITDYKLKEDQLKKHEQEFKALFDGIEEIIYVSDPETYEIVHINDTGKKLWGKDLIGEKCYRGHSSEREAMLLLHQPDNLQAKTRTNLPLGI